MGELCQKNVKTKLKKVKYKNYEKNRSDCIDAPLTRLCSLRGTYFVFYSPSQRAIKTPPSKTAHLQIPQANPQPIV
jgi:hypothetical protein